MDWLSGEPSLDEALCDPIILALMACDGVDAAGLGAFLGRIARALRPAPDAPYDAPCHALARNAT